MVGPPRERRSRSGRGRRSRPNHGQRLRSAHRRRRSSGWRRGPGATDARGLLPGVARRFALGRRRARHAGGFAIAQRALADLVRRRRDSSIIPAAIGVLGLYHLWAITPVITREHRVVRPSAFLVAALRRLEIPRCAGRDHLSRCTRSTSSRWRGSPSSRTRCQACVIWARR